MSHSYDTVNHVQNLYDKPVHLVNACQNCHRHTFSPMILWSLLNLRPKVSIMDNGHNEDFWQKIITQLLNKVFVVMTKHKAQMSM